MDEKNLPVKKAEKGIIMQRYTDYDETTVRMIQPVHDELTYCGRIDHSDPDAPVFVQPGQLCAHVVYWIFLGSGSCDEVASQLQ